MTRALLNAAMLVAAIATVATTTAAQTAPAAARQLIARVVEGRADTAFRVHATLTHTTAATNVKLTRQLLITWWQDASSTKMLYQVQWPKEMAGDALMIQTAGNQRLEGFLYQAGRITTLTPAMRSRRVFDSDLRIEDLTSGMWFWPTHTITGQEAVGAYDCTILESRPGPKTPTDYSRVKTWVSPDLGAALRVEQFGRDGRLAKPLA